MGDSTSMTIEFLRARLLSERTVSKTASQRADQLAKRVLELEEQLRIMVIERKKAEKAAAEVLSILKNQQLGDLAKAIDSSSDQDADGESKENDAKENVTSNVLRVEKNEVEDGLSGSEASLSQGRSLSWKGCSSSPSFHEKHKIKQTRQRHRPCSFSLAIESSGKLHSQRSCHKTRQREMRSATVGEVDKFTLNEDGEKGAAKSNLSGEQLEFPREDSRNELDELFPHTLVKCSLGDWIKDNVADRYAKRRDIDGDMKRVLEQQARLIGQYQAEEIAQREWEEKYNENKSSTLDFYEPGNQPETAETYTEPKEEATKQSGKNTYYSEEAVSKAEHISNTEEQTTRILSNASVPTLRTPHAIVPEKSGSSNKVTAMVLSNGLVPPHLTRHGESNSQARSNGVPGQQHNGTQVQDTESSSKEFAFPVQENSNISTNGKQHQRKLYGNGSRSTSNLHPHGNGILESPSSGSPSSANSGNKFSRWRSPEMQNHLQRLVPQSSSSRLGGVLQTLQHAKASLGQVIPLSNQGTLAIVAPTDSHVRTMKYGGDLDIPIGPTGQFRLPTDTYPQADFSMPKFYGSGLSLTSTNPDAGYAITPSEYQYPAMTYVESGPRVSVGRQYFDPYITSSMGKPGSTRYSLSYSHLTAERSPSRDEFLKSRMDLRNGMPAGDRRSLYGIDGALPNTQRL